MESLQVWLLSLLVIVTCVTAAPASSLPIVDLIYQRHQAAALNSSTGVYNFSNIRFAEPPVGNLRWAAPVPPSGKSSAVTNGANQNHICPQAGPAWEAISTNFSVAWIEGKGNDFNFTASYDALLAEAAANPGAILSTPDPRTSEDCLFLDVFVPKSIYNKKVPASGKGGAAVMVWIYGGGYTEGYKSSYGSPEVLQTALASSGGQSFIFVEMNYRNGAFGFLGGPSVYANGGVSNAALYDQRAALEWVQKYIHLFGGDPNRVTVAGESAGGGSVVHQITAFGGLKSTPFQQAIPQSAAWEAISSNFVQENNTQTFFGLLNVSSLAEARQLPSSALIQANAMQVLLADYGGFVYGPAVDGVFVPAQPGQLLAAGAFDKNVKVMSGHNAHEAVGFTDPRLKTDATIVAYIQQVFPGIQPSILQEILKLYPAVYNGSYPWTTPIDRAIDLISEAFFTCPQNWLQRALGNNSYAYEFEVPPALHGFDVPYTFYDGEGMVNTTEGTLVVQVAKVFQAYIGNFVTTGNPNGKGLPNFSTYGSGAMEEGLNFTGIKMQMDPDENPRCLFWQEALYY